MFLDERKKKECLKEILKKVFYYYFNMFPIDKSNFL